MKETGAARPAGLLQRSLRARLITAFFLLSLTVVALLAGYSSWSIARQSARNTLVVLEGIADLKEQSLQDWVREQGQKVRWLAGMPGTLRLGRQVRAWRPPPGSPRPPPGPGCGSCSARPWSTSPSSGRSSC